MTPKYDPSIYASPFELLLSYVLPTPTLGEFLTDKPFLPLLPPPSDLVSRSIGSLTAKTSRSFAPVLLTLCGFFIFSLFHA